MKALKSPLAQRMQRADVRLNPLGNPHVWFEGTKYRVVFVTKAPA
jgi:hypothetical protein